MAPGTKVVPLRRHADHAKRLEDGSTQRYNRRHVGESTHKHPKPSSRCAALVRRVSAVKAKRRMYAGLRSASHDTENPGCVRRGSIGSADNLGTGKYTGLRNL